MNDLEYGICFQSSIVFVAFLKRNSPFHLFEYAVYYVVNNNTLTIRSCEIHSHRQFVMEEELRFSIFLYDYKDLAFSQMSGEEH